MSTVSQDDAHALRRKVEDLSRQHEQIVSGLTGEVDRLHNVCHGLMLQLVMNGLSPSVPSGPDDAQRMYEGVLEAVRAGDLQLPARLPVPSDPAPEQPREPAEQARAAADQPVGAAVEPAPPARASEPAHGRPRVGSGDYAESKALAPPPEPSPYYHVPSPSPGRSPERTQPQSPSRPLNPAHSLPPIARESPAPDLAVLGSPTRSRSDAAAAGSADPLGLMGASAATEQSDDLGSPSAVGVTGGAPIAGPSGMPRVLRKGGAVGSGGMRRPRTLAPLHTTERSAMGGFGVRTNRPKPKAAATEREQPAWPAIDH